MSSEWDLLFLPPGSLVVFQYHVRATLLGDPRQHWIIPVGSMGSYLGRDETSGSETFGINDAIYEILELENLWYEHVTTYDQAILAGGRPDVQPYKILKANWAVSANQPIKAVYSTKIEQELTKILQDYTNAPIQQAVTANNSQECSPTSQTSTSQGSPEACCGSCGQEEANKETGV